MKNTLSHIIMVVIAVMFSQYVYAQKSVIALQRKIIDEAISTIEDYEAYATIGDDEVRYEFVDLFVDGNAPVFNDLLGLSNKNILTAQEYCDLLSKGPRSKIVRISNLKKEMIWKDGDEWKVLFSLDKSIAYSDQCEVYFSSRDFYGKDYRLMLTLVYDENEEKCKIEGIKGTIDSQRRLPETYFVFESKNEWDKYLFYDGKEIDLNSHQQSILSGTMIKELFRFIDPDMKMSPIVNDCGIVSMKYHVRKMWLKVHFDLSLNDVYKCKNSSTDLTIGKNALNTIGLDFGYVFPTKSKMKAGLFVGVGFSQLKFDLNYMNADYAFITSADVDDDSYIRHYQDLKVNQGIKMTDLTVPLYADFIFNFSRIFSAYVDLGVKFHLNMSHKVDTSEGSAYIYGIYPQYDNLRMDEHWGYNGFGNATFSANNLDNAELLDVAKFTADALVGLGLRINIPRTPIAIDLGLNYQMGLMDVIKANSKSASMLNATEPSHALVYNTISELSSTEHLRNLTELWLGVKRQVLMFNAGLILKF